MAKFYSELTQQLRTFITDQKMFFIATAPHQGRINLSPKGLDTFRILDDRTVGYLDVTGSGNETAAHIEENGRVTMMFCSFDKSPMILRLYGRGRVVRLRDSAWQTYAAHFEDLPGLRQLILLDIESVQTSCGFGVPLYEFVSGRDTLLRSAEKAGEEGIRQYQLKKNQVSIDGLPTKLFDD
jgi:hypothetical protein